MTKVQPLREFIQDVRAGNVDEEEFLHSVMEACSKLDEEYEPFITLRNVEEVLEEGRGLLKTKGKMPLVPFSVKDNICTAGVRTTAGSKILHDYIPFFDATCVKALKDEGAVLIGKTATDEFGFGTFCTNCAFCTPKNPHDKSRVCGGSSGGAACITALASFPHVAIAESTGGSIACPASFCGVFGFTPTYGVVSRYGLVDYANSLDKIGLMAKYIDDIMLAFEFISRRDERDSTCVGLDKEDHDITLERITLGIPKEFVEAVTDEKVLKTFQSFVKKLEGNGVNIVQVSIPSVKYALAAYYIVATAEASTNLAKFCGMRYGYEKNPEGKHYNEYFSEVRSEGFGEEAKRRILLGTFARMAGYRDAYYLRALKVRTLVIREFEKALKNADFLLAPTMPVLPPRFEDVKEMSPAEVYAMDVLTVPANFAGLPHISLPCGSVAGLPVGVQLMGRHFSDWKMLSLAKIMEEAELTHSF